MPVPVPVPVTVPVPVPAAKAPSEEDEETVLRQMAVAQRRWWAQVFGGVGAASAALFLLLKCCRRRGLRSGAYSSVHGEAYDASSLAPTCCALDIADNASQAGSTISHEQIDTWDDFDIDEDGDDGWGSRSTSSSPPRMANLEPSTQEPRPPPLVEI